MYTGRNNMGAVVNNLFMIFISNILVTEQNWSTWWYLCVCVCVELDQINGTTTTTKTQWRRAYISSCDVIQLHGIHNSAVRRIRQSMANFVTKYELNEVFVLRLLHWNIHINNSDKLATMFASMRKRGNKQHSTLKCDFVIVKRPPNLQVEFSEIAFTHSYRLRNWKSVPKVITRRKQL